MFFTRKEGRKGGKKERRKEKKHKEDGQGVSDNFLQNGRDHDHEGDFSRARLTNYKVDVLTPAVCSNVGNPIA